MTEFPARVIIPFGFVIICLANVPVYLVNGDDDCLLFFLLTPVFGRNYYIQTSGLPHVE